MRIISIRDSDNFVKILKMRNEVNPCDYIYKLMSSMDLKLDNLITLALFSGIFIWKREIKDLFHITLEKFQNENFTPKTLQMFPVHVTPEIFENANSVFFVDTN